MTLSNPDSGELFLKLPVKLESEGGFVPEIPIQNRELSDYCDWTAKYYPSRQPYQYVIVRCFNFKEAIPKKLEKTMILEKDLQSDYLTYLLKQRDDKTPTRYPHSETWDFESDTDGSLPAGWSEQVANIFEADNVYFFAGSMGAIANYNATSKFAAATGGLSQTDCVVTAKQRYPDGSSYLNSWKLAGVAVRVQSGAIDSCYIANTRIRDSAGTYLFRVQVVSSGSFTVLASYSLGSAPTDDTWYDIKLSAEDEGSDVRLKGYWNDNTTPKINYLEAPKTWSSGYVGVMFYQSAKGGMKPHAWDNIVWSDIAAVWGHKFNGVANANIAKINGVSTANIAKVNGVA